MGAGAKMVIWFLAAVLTAVLIVRFYVRHAPHDPEFFHSVAGRAAGVPAEAAPGDYPQPGGFAAVRHPDEPVDDAFARLARLIEATPRTTWLAGSVAEGHVSFVTRTAFWGFPDTTNIHITGEGIQIHGHLRFGRSDFGVNQRRIEAWLALLAL